MLDFMTNTASDYEIEWTHEIVRAADTYGVVLKPVKQVKGVDQGMLDELRGKCEVERKRTGFTWKGMVS